MSIQKLFILLTAFLSSNVVAYTVVNDSYCYYGCYCCVRDSIFGIPYYECRNSSYCGYSFSGGGLIGTIIGCVVFVIIIIAVIIICIRKRKNQAVVIVGQAQPDLVGGQVAYIENPGVYQQQVGGFNNVQFNNNVQGQFGAYNSGHIVQNQGQFGAFNPGQNVYKQEQFGAYTPDQGLPPQF